jgi:hypothetical protein
MNCDTCLTVIDRFFEGDLDDRVAGEVAAHVASCARCTTAVDDLQREQEMYSRYLLEVEATPAVWSGISAGIAKQKLNRAGGLLPSLRGWVSGQFVHLRWSPVVTAVSIVLMLGLVLVLAQYLNRRASERSPDVAKQNELSQRQPANDSVKNANLPSNPRGTVAENQPSPIGDQAARPPQFSSGKRPAGHSAERSTRPDTAAVAQSTEIRAGDAGSRQIVMEAERGYLNAIAVLSREFENRRTKLSPQRLATLNQALSAIDQTIADTSLVAHRQSNDSLAVHYMLLAYTNKIDLLREAVF